MSFAINRHPGLIEDIGRQGIQRNYAADVEFDGYGSRGIIGSIDRFPQGTISAAIPLVLVREGGDGEYTVGAYWPRYGTAAVSRRRTRDGFANRVGTGFEMLNQTLSDWNHSWPFGEPVAAVKYFFQK